MTCDTGSFQSRLLEHVESIAPSHLCKVVIIHYACSDIEGYDTIWYQRVTIRLLVSITGDVLHAQIPCVLYVHV